METDAQLQMLADRVSALEHENQQFFRWSWAAIVFLNALAMIKVLGLFMQTGKFRKMFTEMLAGEPLPLVTRLMLSYSHAPMMASVTAMIVLVLLGMLGSKKHLTHTLGIGVSDLDAPDGNRCDWYVRLLRTPDSAD